MNDNKKAVHIGIFVSTFYPEMLTSSRIASDIISGLNEKIYRISVFTGYPNRPGGILFKDYKRKIFSVEDHKNFLVFRNWHFFSRKSISISRMLENISFGFSVGVRFIFSEKPNIVYLNVWPVFASFIISRLCIWYRVPYIVHIQDLYPESFLDNRKYLLFIKKIMLYLDNYVVKNSYRTITISNEFMQVYINKRKIDKAKFETIKNWRDENEIVPRPRNELYRSECNVKSLQFVVMFAGNLSMAAGIDLIIELANALEEDHDIVFIVAGNGTDRERLSCSVESKNLKNIIIKDWPMNESATDVHAAADIMLLPTSKGSSLTSVPSKLIAYMMFGKPVIALVDRHSETAGIIRDSGCGWVFDEDQIKEAADLINKIKYKKSELMNRGILARNYAVGHFSKKKCLPKLINVIEEALNKNNEQ